MNLLPFPALDGGRLLIFLLEGITKRKIPEKVEGTINMVGFVLLMGLMVVIMGNDIRKLFLH
jgi:regulator of sigma E protease